jgi:hypothetical protein
MSQTIGDTTLPDLQQFPDISLKDVGGSAVDFAKGLNTTENDVFSQYMAKQKAQPTSLQIYDQTQQAAGIPELKKSQATLQGQVYSLEDSLRRLEPDIAARSGNSIVTQSQRNGMIDAASKPLQENLGTIGTALGRVSSAISDANKDVTTRVGYQMDDLKAELQPYKDQLTLLSDQNARLMTGFSTDQSNELSILMAKIARNEQISDTEYQTAKDLALKNMDYENAMKENAAVLNKPENQVVEANGHKYLIDTKTGNRIADLGSTKSPSSAASANPYSYITNTNTNPWG